MVYLAHVSGGGMQTAIIPTEMPVWVFQHVKCHLAIYMDATLKSTFSVPTAFFSGRDMFAVFYELGLCASLEGEEKQGGGEGGTALLCHQSNFWSRLQIEKRWGKKCSAQTGKQSKH